MGLSLASASTSAASADANGQAGKEALLRLQRAREVLASGLLELKKSRSQHEAMRTSIGAELRQATVDLCVEGGSFPRKDQCSQGEGASPPSKDPVLPAAKP